MGRHPSVRDLLVVHLPVLRRYAHGLTGHRADAEDLLQATLLRAIEHEKSWRGENGRAWLYAIMTNLNLNRLRGRSRQPVLISIDDTEEMGDGRNSDPLVHNQLVRALGALEPDARAALLLVSIEGFTYREAADILNVPIGTVMSRLSRARRQLSARVDYPSVTPFVRR
ncbi:RNA polymerase sigma factor [Pelagibacterium luteolum]|uniref:RNA polymerase sigma-70 factor, ECF subfamily n=1 Tax=Pelagibacterium luteolum TaxID=440168 RepID=A0A1G7SF15_9HYPH|nr:RNA polymerase sigma factor [Pelagibacterium luteolum]SDG21593.1 RNA polymerase sigma-70 factor, ECF subfamily [Pelagibacterium luteolum]